MARIIESTSQSRRIIKLTAEEVISIVREYQRIVPRGADYSETRNLLEDTVVYIPEDI